MTGALLDLDAFESLGDAFASGLGERVRTAGFDAGFMSAAEAIAPGRFDALRLPLVHTWLGAQAGPAATLALVFAYQGHAPRAQLEAALGSETTAALARCGALRGHDDAVYSRLRLMPFGGLLLASDEADAHEDPVMGPGATTQELLDALPSALEGRLLDVGCGAGSLALAAAHRGATEVVGVDIDPRAVALARFNARVNGIDNARFATGDLLEPVAGDTFAYVVAQPPFVTQPPEVEAATYLHGGSRGDELALRMLGQIPAALGPGGRALVLMDTAPPASTSLLDHLQSALGTRALQVVVVDAPGHGVDDQALGYASAAHGDLGPDFARAAGAYWTHLRALGVDKTRHALLAIRRPSDGEPHYTVRVEPRSARGYVADEIADTFAALRVATLPPAALLERRVMAPPTAQLVQAHPLGSEANSELRFHGPGGRAPDQSLSDAAAMLLDIIRRVDTIAEVVEAYAQTCSDEAATVEQAVLEFVRSALVSGLLVPAETSA